MFEETERVQYRKPPVLETLCQLRFPTILSISAKEPAEFQELIRSEFPRYNKLLEKQPPQVMQGPGGPKVREQPDIINYQFLSADGRWKVNLTNHFIALATPSYTTWEEFAGKLDTVLSHFISVYQPSYFERIGLRYVNAFSRKALDLEEVPFRELIQPGYLGLMADDDVDERSFLRSMQTSEVRLPGNCVLNLKCGPGMIKRGNVEDKEVRFIFDIDIFMASQVELKHSAGVLTTIHAHANRIFRGAITRALHEAMEPM